MPNGIELALWGALGVTAYSYAGYGALMAAWARLAPRPTRRDEAHRPAVTLVIAAYNEAELLEAKLENSLALRYPEGRLEILVVSDGSTDRSPEIARGYADRGVRSLYAPERRGKLHAVDRAVKEAKGEIVVLSDANAFYNPEAVEKLVRHFADPAVGMVAGEKRVASGGEAAGEGEGLYWRYESAMKRHDAAVHSAMGAAGEILAVRRALYEPVPADTIIEDFALAMRVIERGYRVAYEPEALATESGSASLGEEYKRKVRIAAGGYQAVWRARGLFRPRFGPVGFMLASHRALRWVVVPWLFPLMLLANAALVARPGYAALLGLQLAGYALAVQGFRRAAGGKRARKIELVACYLVMMNAAAIAGAFRHFGGTQSAVWEKARRAPQAA